MQQADADYQQAHIQLETLEQSAAVHDAAQQEADIMQQVINLKHCMHDCKKPFVRV